MATNYNPKIITDNLVLCLDAGNIKSYPGSGTTWNDLSGFNQNFTISGPDYISTSPAHFSFIGNQTDNIFRTPSSIFNNLTNLTVSLWLRLDNLSTTHAMISYASPSGSPNEYLLYYDGLAGRLDCWFKNISTASFLYTLPVNVWFNLVNVVTPSTNEVYYNGLLAVSANKTPLALATDGYISLGQEQDLVGGGFDPGQDLEGDIAQLLVYNRSLLSNEVFENFQAHKNRFGI
jgi:hypothetical protein